jgi:hypothetical protein
VQGGSAGSAANSGDEAGASSGGEAGSAGSVDTAGDGGEGPKPECVSDADCSDHLACNGSETCDDGVCKPGVAPCANPEPAHCDAICTELNGAASCTVRGQDNDKDGHFSSACTAKPGDDCNDASAKVYPGAPELCDGIDNNCNGKIDLADGLSAGGSTVAIGPNGATSSLPAIAWATDKLAYGIAYEDTTTSSAADGYFEEVDQNGATKVAPASFNGAATKIKGGFDGLDMAWGGDSFGIAWIGANGAFFETIGSSGSPGAVVTVLPASSGTFINPAFENPSIARVAGGNWGMLFGVGNARQINTISSAGSLSAPTNVGSHSIYPSMAASGSDFAIAFIDGPGIVAGFWTSALVEAKPLSVSGLYPIVGSGPNGIGIAVQGTTGPLFYEFATSGTTQCGPVNIGDSNFKPASVVPTPKGYLVVSSGTLRAQEVHADCTLGPIFTIDPGPAGNIHAAAGAAGYGVVWVDTTGAPKRHLFGANFCD